VEDAAGTVHQFLLPAEWAQWLPAKWINIKIPWPKHVDTK
jgi:hypothetical protein